MPREDIYAPRLPKGNDDQQQTTGPDADNYFNTYIGAAPSTLDISRRMDSYSSIVMMNTMEGLVRADSDENGDLVIIPGEAESWEANEDGTVWTFHLRDGLKWQDGEPVTAEQYVYSLQRSADPNTACPNSFFLEPLLNYKDISEGTKPTSELGVKAVDEKTLEITLTASKPTFLQMLGSTLYYPQRQDVIEANGEKFGSEAFLSYMGLGIKSPNTSWGALASNAQAQFMFYPFQLFFPAVMIAVTMLAFTMMGDGLRDALDSRLRK